MATFGELAVEYRDSSRSYRTAGVLYLILGAIGSAVLGYQLAEVCEVSLFSGRLSCDTDSGLQFGYTAALFVAYVGLMLPLFAISRTLAAVGDLLAAVGHLPSAKAEREKPS